MEQQTITCNLPNGQKLTAQVSGDQNVPSIDIFMEDANGEVKSICFTEFVQDEGATVGELFAGVYREDRDELAYYEKFC